MFNKILDEIDKAKKILVPLHIMPDGDSVGSALALEAYLKSLGKEVYLISYHKVPEYLARILDTKNIIENFDYENFDFSEVDLLLAADIAEQKLLTDESIYKLPENLKIICIDHHPSNTLWGEINLIDTEASSTASLLYRSFSQKDLITTEMLKPLAVGIITDTGNFKNFNTKPEDFEIMADIMKKGLAVNELLQEFLVISLDDIHYKAIVYKNTELNNEEKYVYSYCTKENLKDAGFGVDKKFAGGITDIRFVEGAEFAFFLKEKNNKGDSDFSVAFRSINPEIDVSIIAERLNGGGHKTAAGGIIRGAGTIDTALAEVEGLIHLLKDSLFSTEG